MLPLAIIMHNYPFSYAEHENNRLIHVYLNPEVKPISRNTAKQDVIKIYKRKKESLKLQDLTIDCRISNWMTLATSPGLKQIYLEQCIDVEHLPFLGKLPFLESLTIEESNSLKKMNLWAIEPNNNKKEEGSTSSSLILFPNLKSLSLGGLEEWEEWDGKEGGCVTIMPRLQELIIGNCPKLKWLPDFLPTTQLKRLSIFSCPILSQRYERETGEDWPKISQIPDIRIYD